MMIITKTTIMKILLMNINIQTTGKDEDYKVDKDPEDKHEEDASLTEKIKDKFTNNDDDNKNKCLMTN